MDAEDICGVFHACFEHEYQTRLLGGATEPLYEPVSNESPWHSIFFREDFTSSALHEVAHWCIAGKSRRRQLDFGYQYEGQRDVAGQRAFEALEAKPQGLEWIFSVAAGVPFRVSCDNFDERVLDLDGFREKVRAAAREWLARGLPERAGRFAEALSRTTGQQKALNVLTYRELPR